MNETAQLVSEAAKAAAEKAAEGLRTFGNNVAAVSKEIMTSAKLNSQKSQKIKENNECYRKLGEIAYNDGGLSGEMAELAEQIKQNYEALQEIEVKLNNLSNEKVCAECGRKNVNDGEYCSKCGEKL